MNAKVSTSKKTSDTIFNVNKFSDHPKYVSKTHFELSEKNLENIVSYYNMNCRRTFPKLIIVGKETTNLSLVSEVKTNV